MLILANDRIRMAFDEQGRLATLGSVDGVVRVPLDLQALTKLFVITLRSEDGRRVDVSPQSPPTMRLSGEDGKQVLSCWWALKGEWGSLEARTRVVLPRGSPVSEWTMEVENRTPYALWQVAYPRVSGLTAHARDGTPDWLAAPFLMGEKTPNPVAFVNHHTKQVDSWARNEYWAFDVEGGSADIAYSYPGMWVMQFLAYGHPSSGGIYFAAHDSQALYKRFGLYADHGDGRHAALVLKQYPRDRLAAGASFTSPFPAAIGAYAGDWWGASAIYRQWALQQVWCRRGPTRDRQDIPSWAKALDLWYWNWQFHSRGHPDLLVPAIEYLKERFGCEIAFHWYGYNGEQFGGGWRTPEEYPDNPDIRETLVAGVRRLHSKGIRCIPYINARLWSPKTRSFREADGMKWIAVTESGQPSHEWPRLGYTMCPTAPPFHRLIARITNEMIDGCEMDGAYLDQISSCYSVPCFSRDHNHGPGGHDHWCRGYRQLLELVQREIKRRSPDNVITSESVIECYLDLLDLDLAREMTNIRGMVGCPDALPIPMFHSVYHDYHMTYGTVQTFQQRDMAHFYYAEALCLVGGQQLMVSGFFAGDDKNVKFKPQLDYLETLVKAHKAARRWLNLGVWKPPVSLQCDLVEVSFAPDQPPKPNIPAIVTGCFELDGELCIVLVNHTSAAREATFRLDPRVYGLLDSRYALWSFTSASEGGASSGRPRNAGADDWRQMAVGHVEPLEHRARLGPLSAEVLVLTPI